MGLCEGSATTYIFKSEKTANTHRFDSGWFLRGHSRGLSRGHSRGLCSCLTVQNRLVLKDRMRELKNRHWLLQGGGGEE